MARPRSDIEPRLIAAARDRFLADGVDGASLRAIAAAAGTSIGMVYYYFPTKDDLFLAVLEETYEKLVQDMERTLDPALPVRERLERLFERIAAFSEDELLMVRLVLREALVSSTRLTRVLERFRRGHIPLLLRTVADGVLDGTFDRNLHPLVIAMSMLALAAPPQLVRRFLGDRLPIAGSPEGPEFGRMLLRVLLEGAGGKGTA